MAGSLNEVNLIGNVTKDPEHRSTQSGAKIVNFSLATNETWKDRNTGERKERSEFHRIVVFNEGLAGVIERFVRKGSRLFVRGSLQTRKWQNQSGQDRYSTEVVLSAYNGQIILLDGKGSGERQSDDRAPSGSRREPSMAGGGGFDEEIPFMREDR